MEDLYIATVIVDNKYGEDYVEVYTYIDKELAEKEHPEITFYQYEWNEKKQQYTLQLPF